MRLSKQFVGLPVIITNKDFWCYGRKSKIISVFYTPSGTIWKGYNIEIDGKRITVRARDLKLDRSLIIKEILNNDKDLK